MSELKALRIGYLGPSGTFSEEAVLKSVGDRTPSAEPERVPLPSIREAIMATEDGRVDCSLVPIENSTEGSVTVTLDTLATTATELEIVGETVIAINHCLLAREAIELTAINTVVSHPQASGQCAAFLRNELPQARLMTSSSTAEAVRIVSQNDGSDWAALGTRLAGDLYHCQVLRTGVQDIVGNKTRFVWLRRRDSKSILPWLVPVANSQTERTAQLQPYKTSLVFWGPETNNSGWLVACLSEFSRRKINLTRIESRPQQQGLGLYMFFVDLQGATGETNVTAAINGLENYCEVVRILGSYGTT